MTDWTNRSIAMATCAATGFVAVQTYFTRELVNQYRVAKNYEALVDACAEAIGDYSVLENIGYRMAQASSDLLASTDEGSRDSSSLEHFIQVSDKFDDAIVEALRSLVRIGLVVDLEKFQDSLDEMSSLSKKFDLELSELPRVTDETTYKELAERSKFMSSKVGELSSELSSTIFIACSKEVRAL